MTGALRSLAAELDELGREAACPHAPPEIPDFRLTDVLGRGGMGTVYLAEQVSLGREVALKIVPRTSQTSQTLPDEARTVAQLHHPNIVQVHAAGTTHHQSWFAMELMRGKSASHSTFASAEDVARLGIQIAEALSYAHRCGVIHRDVKPSNIFIGENGIAKLGDFGLANSMGGGGTRRYMAPELLDDAKATESSDQYALGVTLRELAHKEKQPEQLEATCSGTRANLPSQSAAPGGAASRKGCPRLSKLFPNPDFEAICAKAAAQDPSRRYESMDAMLDDLRRFLAHKPVAANPPSPFRRFRLFARRNPIAASGIAAASVLLAAFVAALAVGYVKTNRALAATEREAASAAQSLAKVITETDRTGPDRRDAEITRALTAAEHLAARFPDNAEIADAVDRLQAAREAHARFLERRGGEMFPRRRFRHASRHEPHHVPRHEP